MQWKSSSGQPKNKKGFPYKASARKDVPHTRVNYEDHSLKFLDWVDHLGFERTGLGRVLLFMEERWHLKKCLIVFFMSLIMSFLMTFDWRSGFTFQIGDVAKYDVLSPISFEMVDEVSTEERRLRAEKSIPLIFDFDSKIFEKTTEKIFNVFKSSRSAMRDLNPKNQETIFSGVASNFDAAFDLQVPHYLMNWLFEQRFNTQIESVVVRNLFIWYQNKLTLYPEKSSPTDARHVLVRTRDRQNTLSEIPMPSSQVKDISKVENFQLSDIRGLERMNEEDRKHLLELTRLFLNPNLNLNQDEMNQRLMAARNSIPSVSISIKKNQVIIPEGTIVQPYHMALIKEIESLKSEKRIDFVSFGMAFLILILLILFYQFLRKSSFHQLDMSDKDIYVIGLITAGVLFVSRFFSFMVETSIITHLSGLVPIDSYFYIMPLASGAMLVGLLMTVTEVVWIFSVFLAFLIGFMFEFNFSYVVVTLSGCLVGAQSVLSCKKRNDIYWAGLKTGLIQMVVIFLITISRNQEPDLILRDIMFNSLAGFLSGILSSFIAMAFVPILESLFSYTTDVKLLELSNLNHPLLKEMIVRAPGTYHHSMMVGSMVEAAAEEIGANPLLAKVMSYYHDIGKMVHSNYFIENQKPGQNPHDHISPFMSKTLLIAHVKDGVELGIEHKLGKPIIDGMIQHHGTTLISYFYNKAIDMRNSEEDAEIDEENFKYPGPKPQFREAALCMLADSIEAAARSLDEPTPVRLQNIVRNIVQRKFMEGQLDECSLTLKDLSQVEMAFTRILLGIYHQRIDYPRSAGGGTGAIHLKPISSNVGRS